MSDPLKFTPDEAELEAIRRRLRPPVKKRRRPALVLGVAGIGAALSAGLGMFSVEEATVASGTRWTYGRIDQHGGTYEFGSGPAPDRMVPTQRGRLEDLFPASAEAACEPCGASPERADFWESPTGPELLRARWYARGDSESAKIEAGLRWLSRVQGADGSWGSGEVGVTSRALLAYLRAGHTHRFGLHRPAVSRGLRWLRARAQKYGPLVSSSRAQRGLAALALVEALVMSRDFKLRSPALRLLACQDGDQELDRHAALARWVAERAGLLPGSCPHRERPDLSALSAEDIARDIELGALDEACWRGASEADARRLKALEELGFDKLDEASDWSRRLAYESFPEELGAEMLWLLQIPSAYKKRGD